MSASRFPVARVRAFSEQVFAAGGLSPEDAATVTDVLIHADLRGHASHGLTRIPIYLERIRRGAVKARPSIAICRPAPGLLAVDGDNGPGPVVSLRAVDAAIETAREQGVCVAAVAHSNHNGSGSYYVERALANGCLAVALTNAPPSMAVHGGRGAVIGTNPISFGAPAGGGEGAPAILLDMATSVVARGKIVEAAKRGEQVPAGWALDSDGRPTTDAATAEKGVVLPMAGAKGSGLALMVEILSGVLSGGRFAGSLGNLYSDFETPQDVGHFFLVIAPQSLPGGGAFPARMDRLIAEMRDSPLAEGVSAIRLPGEPEAAQAAAALADGIALAANVLDELAQAAASVGVPALAGPRHAAS
ncbi:Ldh family oxidoreductase [Thalassobaculum sp. OXR-137]|uniref:Ldh family oxidoreductase n=1 Tax=Thalassobaculum sp. OXR-137 TaxID=3100173 RepID=UPI002AC8CA95|nr:Ldh family oxidoreductase [Thalassobaculum sp. OXR-137]WPZ32745.1 Ldh family oxidoreductase [Thalassobaculum sp. OXR-137]